MISRREAIRISGSALAGLSLGALQGENLQARAAQQSADWPDQLVQRPMREGFPAPLPLNADGSAPEHQPDEAGPISGPLMWRTPDRQAPQMECDFKQRTVKVEPLRLSQVAATNPFAESAHPPDW